MKQKQGCMHLYYGDGKGKTTAAVGLCLRAAGAGWRVVFVQFLKGRETGELAPLKRLGATILRGKEGMAFSFCMAEEQRLKTKQIHDANLQEAIRLARQGGVDLLVLDEAAGALSRGLLDQKLLKDFLEDRPRALELCLTGRNPPDWLYPYADYCSEFVCRRHPFECGIAARKGIEY